MKNSYATGKAVTVLLFLCLLSFCENTYAQLREEVIRGRIVDLYTKKPVQSVHVVNLTTLKASNTDENGFFYLAAALVQQRNGTRE